ncbi:hypothetical protein C4K68_27570 [Pokkaliibacter plantistimulans]|uniref:diguanylate cyclase n=1 Tax=Proteobacteria bacterium 228 TaxID=2083153 RepID=A0A2S5KH76_9PROT|nr:GGDEF domain-containing protein [Pokkaliibacter plantistimulans]PPC74167.1 hypothetical protein C4K68_27570 [Pokkaliibacter plantistimulans]
MDDQIELRLKQCTKLPSLPSVALQLVEAAGKPDLDPDEVISILAKDPALAAKVIRVANSPLYGQLSKTQNLNQAIIKLGLHSVITLSLSFSITHGLRSEGQPHLLQVWKRSLISSIVARLIGQRHNIPNKEDLFLAALLQDIGMLALDAMDDSYQQIVLEAKTHQDILRLERQTYKTDHTEVGHWLLQQWNFPDLLCNAIQFSDDLAITQETEEVSQFLSIIALSGRIADIWLHPSIRQASFTAMIANQKLVKLTDNEFQEVIDYVTSQMESFGQLFNIQLFSSKQAEQIQETASEVLAIRNLTLLREIRKEREKVDILEEQNRYLEDQVKRDPLTGLYNRRYLEHIMAIEFSEAEANEWPLSLIFMDLDNFKDINDRYGHPTGDEVLKKVSRYMERQLRRSDVVARYGGEEFVILLPNTRQDDTERLALRLKDGIKQLSCISEHGDAIHVSTSVGVACHSSKHPFAGANALIAAADKMLYEAKNSGRDLIRVYQRPEPL